MSTYTPIASQTITNATSIVNFSNIPQNYTDLVIVFNGGISTTDLIYNRFNSDSSSKYFGTVIFNTTGGSVVSARETNATYMTGLGWGCAIENNLNNNATMTIQNYSNTTTYKSTLTRSNTPGRGVGFNVNLWKSNSAITSIEFGIPTGGATIIAGSTFNLYGIVAGSPKALGGNTVTTDGTYWYHTFISSGTFTPAQSLTADYLVVAGGGGGGSQVGAGGGAGGYRHLTAQSLTAQAYTVTVGAGGAGGTAAGNGVANSKGSSGSNSVFSTITASGGGGGASYGASYKDGISGGSGGGGSYQDSPSSTGTAGSGNAGSYSPVEGFAGGTSSALGSAGGGGGSSAVGSNSVGAAGGAGGAGTANSISGSSVTYAGGGGGASNSGSAAAGGAGGGGSGGVGAATVSTAGTVNTGGGGGGQRDAGGANGSSGGSGIVIVRYAV